VERVSRHLTVSMVPGGLGAGGRRHRGHERAGRGSRLVSENVTDEARFGLFELAYLTPILTPLGVLEPCFHITGIKRFHHPVGDPTPSFETMELSADAGLTMTVYAVKPGSPSHNPQNVLSS
jgi:hypothetical protein